MFECFVLKSELLHGLAVDFRFVGGTAPVSRSCACACAAVRQNCAAGVDEVVFRDVGEVGGVSVVGAESTDFFAVCAIHDLGIGDCSSGGGDDVEGFCWVGWVA